MLRRAVLLLAALPAAAHAFCGFYVASGGASLFNNATQVVLLRDGTKTVLSMQNNYQGPPENFAMVIPVPVVLQKQNVKTLPPDVFARIDQLSAPRLVEFWEYDPCHALKARDVDEQRMQEALTTLGEHREAAVKIEAQFTVGEYEIVVLSAKDALSLESWLKEHKYKIPEGAEPLFRPYIEQGMKFFVARVDVKKVQFRGGMAMLSPLRFNYDSEKFELPVRLGLINAKEKQDLIIHILARQRFEVANYPNATIPTNLDLSPSAKDQFGPFYVSLFDRTLEKNPGAVITEYAWQATTCDPCPVSPLTQEDLLTFGDDVGPRRPNPESVGDGFVLTRLHARYDRSSLRDDLVFSAARAIEGGRENDQDGGGLRQNALPATLNNFQGRYAVRHPWEGALTCEKPLRGLWRADFGHRPAVARDSAFEKRDGALLEKLAEADVPVLQVKGRKALSGLVLGLVPVEEKKPEPVPAPVETKKWWEFWK